MTVTVDASYRLGEALNASWKKWTDPNIKLEPFRVLAGKAADYIREHGWCQRSFNREGKVCAGEALWVLRSDFPVGTYGDAHAHIDQAIGGSLVEWNDEPGRTETEVSGVLDAISEGWL